MLHSVKNLFLPHAQNNFHPHFVREKSLTVLFCAALILFCTSLGGTYVLHNTRFGAQVLSSVLVDLTNAHRIQEHKKALVINPVLESAALLKAKDMAQQQYFAHTSPAGATPWTWFEKVGYTFIYAGENLAIHFTESDSVEKAWIASPSHHANLLSSKFDETGIATYDALYQGIPTTFVVQLFGTRAGSKQVNNTTMVTQDPRASVSEKAPVIETVVSESVRGEYKAAPVILLNEPYFAMAQDMTMQQSDVVAFTPSSHVATYSTFAERLLVNQAKYVQYIYLVIIIMVYSILVAMISIEFRMHHVKNIALGVLLICVLCALSYSHSTFVLSFT